MMLVQPAPSNRASYYCIGLSKSELSRVKESEAPPGSGVLASPKGIAMRKIGIVSLVVIVLVVLALAVLPKFLDVNSYRGQIQSQLQQKLGRPVTLGEMKLSLLPPSVRVANVVIGEDPAFRTGKPFAAVQELYVSVKLLPLLRKDVEISSLELERPQIEMVKSANGKWNFSTLGQPAQQ